MGVATRKSVPTAPSVSLGNIPAEMTGMDPIRGAVAGAIGGAAGAYIMERFQAWWNAMEKMFNGLLMGTIVRWTADNMAVPAQKLEQVPPSKHAYALASRLGYGFTTELVRSIVRVVS